MAAEATYYCRIIFHQFASSTLIRLKFPIEVKSKLIRRMCSSTSLGPKIYTRTGDKGYTSTYGGERLPKTDSIFEALGATDELSSVIGVACEFCDEAGHGDIVPKLEEIQCILQDVGSNIATPRKSSPQRNIEKTKFNVDTTKVLEEWIDAYHNQLPPLRNFILPGSAFSSEWQCRTRSWDIPKQVERLPLHSSPLCLQKGRKKGKNLPSNSTVTEAGDAPVTASGKESCVNENIAIY
ncbi:corrinoid adenosyltransferase MMAB-like isoform X2 [Montipora foliosa]|uniref:corrinoid adenosyltransferase MMAB-like isoform X2 n=1 Tax=Montipora foliosa TaxID=591990 RepID=UPI0035F14AC7